MVDTAIPAAARSPLRAQKEAGRFVLPRAAGHRAGLPQAGSTLLVDARRFSDGRIRDAVRQLRRMLGTGASVTLELCADDPASPGRLQEVCAGIARSLALHAVPNGRLATLVHAGEVPIDEYESIAADVLGAAQRFVLFDCATQLPVSTWRRFASGRLQPAYGGYVRSACPLLADEGARAVLPETGLVAPHGSAWLSPELRLDEFAGADGGLDWPRLRAAVADRITRADRQLDAQPWLEPRLQMDARRNRRIAVNVTGIGNLVALRGLPPADPATLGALAGELNELRDYIDSFNRRIARERGAAPALTEADPTLRLEDGPLKDGWQRRWLRALSSVAVRHRNIVAMSPYAVLPDVVETDCAFTNLLPLIGCADAWCFGNAPDMRSFGASGYRRFHRLAHAVIRRYGARSLIAAGV